jgi:3-isopropylmalate/(R)-2-methylmalate dehydratase large subunit
MRLSSWAPASLAQSSADDEIHFPRPIPPYLTAKDLILAVIGEIGVDGATYRTMYFAGERHQFADAGRPHDADQHGHRSRRQKRRLRCRRKTLRYVRNPQQSFRPGKSYGQAGRELFRRIRVGSGTLEPLVAKPHSPDNRDTAHNCRDVKLDRAYIGSCTGGKITDMIFAANMLKGNTVKIPTFVVPGSTEVHALT